MFQWQWLLTRDIVSLLKFFNIRKSIKNKINYNKEDDNFVISCSTIEFLSSSWWLMGVDLGNLVLLWDFLAIHIFSEMISSIDRICLTVIRHLKCWHSGGFAVTAKFSSLDWGFSCTDGMLNINLKGILLQWFYRIFLVLFLYCPFRVGLSHDCG